MYASATFTAEEVRDSGVWGPVDPQRVAIAKIVFAACDWRATLQDGKCVDP